MTQDNTATMDLAPARRRPFGDLTLTQVVASALAAVTSLALSKYIGVAGSLIGAAVGSVSASVAGAFYRNAITTSVEKVRAVAHQTGEIAPSDTPATPHRQHSGAAAVGFAALGVAVALFVGLFALGVFATGVNLATGGQGLGEKMAIVQVESAPEPAEAEATDEDGATEASPEQAAEGEEVPQDEATAPESQTPATDQSAIDDADSQNGTPSEPAADTMVEVSTEQSPVTSTQSATDSPSVAYLSPEPVEDTTH